MPVDQKLLDILCCPVSQTPLRRLEQKRLKQLNQAIDNGEVQTVTGAAVQEPLDEALITVDDKVIYPVRDSIPVLLYEEGIGTTQFQDF